MGGKYKHATSTMLIRTTPAERDLVNHRARASGKSQQAYLRVAVGLPVTPDDDAARKNLEHYKDVHNGTHESDGNAAG